MGHNHRHHICYSLCDLHEVQYGLYRLNVGWKIPPPNGFSGKRNANASYRQRTEFCDDWAMETATQLLELREAEKEYSTFTIISHRHYLELDAQLGELKSLVNSVVGYLQVPHAVIHPPPPLASVSTGDPTCNGFPWTHGGNPLVPCTPDLVMEDTVELSTLHTDLVMEDAVGAINHTYQTAVAMSSEDTGGPKWADFLVFLINI